MSNGTWVARLAVWTSGKTKRQTDTKAPQAGQVLTGFENSCARLSLGCDRNWQASFRLERRR